ncbi:MAG: di-heme-cytochrome C peroxidase [Pseudomonadota bacterium]
MSARDLGYTSRMNQSNQRLLMLVATLCLAACSRSDPVVVSGDPVPQGMGAINLEQGWSASIQEKSWFTTFGSRLMPYEWFLALEQPHASAPFRDLRHMAAFGLLNAGPSMLNPDGLPVGFTQDTDPNGKRWVGLGCAACHTGQVMIDAQAVRLDGGQSLFDFQRFEDSVIKALSATVSDDDKFARFANALNVAETEQISLRNALVARAQKMRNVQRTNQTPVPYGPGRLDAFGQIFNAVGVQFLESPANRHVPDAPVSFPVLWSAPHLDLVQWNGSAPNAGPGPLFQNVTTALAVFGELEITGHNAKLGYPSSVHFDNLGRIQEWLYALKSPRWPKDLLEQPEAKSVKRGEQVYAQHCESCHAITDRDDPKRKVKVALTPVDVVGTDARMVNNFLEATAASGRFEGQKLAVFAGPTLERRAQSIDLVVHAATGATLRHPLKAARAAAQGYHKVYKDQIDQHPDYYKARSLDGIWASAPYLHNGSVPTLADLLLTPDERPTRFPISHHFDATRVGLNTGITSDAQFDTALPGNSNAGHVFGTELPPPSKTDLLNFLKTL